jgi:hypothetical protein
LGNLREVVHLEDLGLDGSSVLKWKGMNWIDIAQDSDGCCECGSEPSGSTKCG